jgi:uncharacterized protein (DUF2461 family)
LRFAFCRPFCKICFQDVLGVSTLRQFEQGLQTPIRNNLAAIRKALEDASVEFQAAAKKRGPGVWLKANGTGKTKAKTDEQFQRTESG